MDAGEPDRGMTTISYVIATALSMALLVVLANVIVVLYARGVVRSALDEGVRAGTPLGLDVQRAAEVCVERSNEVLDGLLGGPMGADVEFQCAVGDDGFVRARAAAHFEPWIPGSMPTWTFEPEVVSRRDDR